MFIALEVTFSTLVLAVLAVLAIHLLYVYHSANRSHGLVENALQIAELAAIVLSILAYVLATIVLSAYHLYVAHTGLSLATQCILRSAPLSAWLAARYWMAFAQLPAHVYFTWVRVYQRTWLQMLRDQSEFDRARKGCNIGIAVCLAMSLSVLQTMCQTCEDGTLDSRARLGVVLDILVWTYVLLFRRYTVQFDTNGHRTGFHAPLAQ